MAIGTIAKIILFNFGCYQLFMIGICQSYFGGGVGAGGSNGYQNNRGNAWQGYRSYFEQPQQQQQPSNLLMNTIDHHHSSWKKSLLLDHNHNDPIDNAGM